MISKISYSLLPFDGTSDRLISSLLFISQAMPVIIKVGCFSKFLSFDAAPRIQMSFCHFITN